MGKLIKYLVCLMILALPLGGLSQSLAIAKSVEQKEAKKEKVVYITENGKKYHKEGCRFIKNREAIGIGEEEAISKGLLPCGHCFKEASEAKK